MTITQIIYEVTYSDDHGKTIDTDLQKAVLFVRDTYVSAKVNCWVNGNCVATMEINKEVTE